MYIRANHNFLSVLVASILNCKWSIPYSVIISISDNRCRFQNNSRINSPVVIFSPSQLLFVILGGIVTKVGVVLLLNFESYTCTVFFHSLRQSFIEFVHRFHPSVARLAVPRVSVGYIQLVEYVDSVPATYRAKWHFVSPSQLLFC